MSDAFTQDCGPGVKPDVAGLDELDWARVPFEVPCIECGTNLWGETYPWCPNCGVRINWRRVLPIDELRCRKCHYRLLGLTEDRCPECGTPFEWPDVLRAARVRRIRLFELLWFTNPVSGFVHSFRLAAFHPRRLWDEYFMPVPPNVLPLFAFMLVQWLIFAWGWHVAAWTIDPTINSIAQWVNAETPVVDRRTGLAVSGTTRPLRFVYPFRPGPLFLPSMGVWYLATLAALQLLFETKRRLRFRWTDTFRVLVHSTVFASLCTGMWCVLEGLLDSTLFFTRLFVGRSQVGYFILWRSVFVVGLAVTWAHLAIGLKRHLRVPRAWLVSALCLLIGFLTSTALSS